MDALSRLLTLNAPQGSIDKNCPLGGDWQLPHAAGETIGDSLAYRYAGRSATGNAYRRRHDAYAGKGGDSAAKLRPPFAPVWRITDTYRLR
ncbi:AraC family transcriptional regulator [Salmonella sp. NCTC 11881]|nr:AraC family transcriptional regulator [Salmonella sp. NCTC 11881]